MDKEYRDLSFPKKVSILHLPTFQLDILNILDGGMLGFI